MDFAAGVITVRKKKSSDRTTRRVPMSDLLAGALRDWIAAHPGGSLLFCQSGVVDRSKKRGAGKKVPPAGLTRDEVHHHVKHALAGTRWAVVRGLHTLRHSFVSACASAGVDQRLVQEWCGHTNEATSRRYRHLWPSTQRQALDGVFKPKPS